MRQLIVGTIIFYSLVAGLTGLCAVEKDQKAQTKGEILTTYDADGTPVNQGIERKGYHRVTGQKTLINGRATVHMNTSIEGGRRDVSFLSASSYRGYAWSTDTTNSNTYIVYPLTGRMAQIRSSDSTDTATINYALEGE